MAPLRNFRAFPLLAPAQAHFPLNFFPPDVNAVVAVSPVSLSPLAVQSPLMRHLTCQKLASSPFPMFVCPSDVTSTRTSRSSIAQWVPLLQGVQPDLKRATHNEPQYAYALGDTLLTLFPLRDLCDFPLVLPTACSYTLSP